MYTPEIVGVTMASAPGLGIPLKQHLLFADRIAVAELDQMLATEHCVQHLWPNSADDVEWLRDRGILFSVPVKFRPEDAEDPEFREALEHARNYKIDAELPNPTSLLRSAQAAFISRSYVCRALAVALRTSGKLNTVSLLSVPEEGPEPASRKDHVLRIIIGQLPMPDDDIPYDELLDFRTKHAQQLRALRVWAADVAGGKLTAPEVEDKLQYLVAEYEAQLRLLRAGSRGTIEIVATTVGEIAENLLRLKIGEAMKAIFALRHERANLLLAERKLTGREVSYVVDSRRQFSSRKPGV